MIRAVLFDIDGTLVRTGGAGVKAFVRTFSTEFGLHDGAEKLKFAGRTDVSLVREFFTQHGIDPNPELFQKFFVPYLKHLKELVAASSGEVIPGVHEFIAALKNLPRPPQIGLLTGNIREGARIKLSHYQLWQEFAFGGFADDHEERDCIASIARDRAAKLVESPLDGSEVLVIGDTPLDVRCGRAIGAKVLAVATGGSTFEELQKTDADWVENELTVTRLAHYLK